MRLVLRTLCGQTNLYMRCGRGCPGGKKDQFMLSIQQAWKCYSLSYSNHHQISRGLEFQFVQPYLGWLVETMNTFLGVVKIINQRSVEQENVWIWIANNNSNVCFFMSKYIPNKHGKKHCTSGEHSNRFCWGWSLWTFDPRETFGLGEQAGASAGISQRQTSCFLWFVLLLDAQVLRSLEQFALHLVWSLQVTLVGSVPISQLFGETRWLVSSRCPPSSVAGVRESEYPVRRWLQKGVCDHSCCCNGESNQ